ncbi:ADP-ribosylglycohydrolase family protein [Nocardia miyunensis]|uniref:ADP-ribosylglycohydrolase family protein n=1 Tax=Nocardia miyunensis TaxID=282684 RepID=UPI000834AE85|nr:ADP-ribosylglycohydrolase family protein [Nocardia miyunensis]
MTLFTAEGLLRTEVGADPVPALRQAYLRWLDTQRRESPGPDPDGWLLAQPFLYAVRAPGNACLSGLDRQAREYLPARRLGEPGLVNPQSKGCGAVMRSAPFGLIGLGPDAAFTTAARAAQLTHGHPTGYIAAGAFAALIDRVAGGVDLPTAVQQTIAQLTDVPAAGETVQALVWAVEVSQKRLNPIWVEQVGGGWVAEECLAIAVCCSLYAARSGDVRGALLLSVNHSGDSDSTGAVTGNLLGASQGAAALPQDWVSAVEGRAVLIRVADDLVAAFGPPGNGRHERG